MGAVRALLIDLDGVLYVEDDVLPGARSAVEALRSDGLVLRFVTNTTTRPRRGILERLGRLGFAVEPDEPGGVGTVASRCSCPTRSRGTSRPSRRPPRAWTR